MKSLDTKCKEGTENLSAKKVSVKFPGRMGNSVLFQGLKGNWPQARHGPGRSRELEWILFKEFPPSVTSSFLTESPALHFNSASFSAYVNNFFFFYPSWVSPLSAYQYAVILSIFKNPFVDLSSPASYCPISRFLFATHRLNKVVLVSTPEKSQVRKLEMVFVFSLKHTPIRPHPHPPLKLLLSKSLWV